MKEFFSTAAKQVARVSHELILSGALLFLYLSGSYAAYSPAIQVIMLKATLTSLGFIHAHAAGKIAFPKVNWEKDDVDKIEKYLRIALYCVFIHSYAMGG